MHKERPLYISQRIPKEKQCDFSRYMNGWLPSEKHLQQRGSALLQVFIILEIAEKTSSYTFCTYNTTEKLVLFSNCLY